MRNHRSLLAWQKAHSLTVAVLKLSSSAWKPQFAAVFRQLQRASLSIQLNIAEGYAFGDSGTLRRHLRIAYGSAVESDDLLELMAEQDHFDKSEVADARELCRDAQKLIFGLMKRYGALTGSRKIMRGPGDSA
jgi:four helix bundle protein